MQQSPSIISKNDTRNLTTKAKSPEALAHLGAGATAGLVSAITLQPFDLLKTRLQQQHTVKISLASELKNINTVKDLWRGTLPSALRTSMGAGLYFTCLSKMRSNWANFKVKSNPSLNTTSNSSVLPKLTPLENLATGFVARAIAGYILMPITIIKTRFESNIYNYNSMYESIKGIYYNEGTGMVTTVRSGSLRNFFKGSVATLIRDCPYAGLYVLSYESFKNDLFPVLIPVTIDHRASIINSGAAVLAATACTMLTAPFDAIKTRLQLTNESSILKASKILVNEPGGVSNLFRGVSLRLGRKAISSGISWCIYEELIKSDFSQNLFVKKERLSS
ncbi:uncharacterized protein SPAPADRAFT_70338 [Spathaspora passalidarum NRRL Y-27907]|uniref:Mitochondrial glycine transporter n=1 Tax=Spathaspora passalidarum (strain NRRL Y-27907 / 11-Y1) TaxID=619300 RepID=G3AHL7_SPAPN|nr:uncharacterized protein SPAPADRAFT_70338 [Spathaspora passalidarum NRRL Y-27907]EGW34181.1 hypothetical protein SPAPADRAFT_70338 [Spathaspora passalidarum NRRL Y-27907]